MLENWVNFGILVFVQTVFFVACAIYVKRSSQSFLVLGRGVLIGLVVGLLFDLILGKFLGLYSYVLGFGPLFLILNGTFSYGIFSASTLLVSRAKYSHFFIWLVLLVGVYEITNAFFPVWIWEFELQGTIFGTVLLIGYAAGALIVSKIEHNL